MRYLSRLKLRNPTEWYLISVFLITNVAVDFSLSRIHRLCIYLLIYIFILILICAILRLILFSLFFVFIVHVCLFIL